MTHTVSSLCRTVFHGGLVFWAVWGLFGAVARSDTVRLVGGQVLEGQVERDSDETLVVRLLSGARVTLDRQRIAEIERESEAETALRLGDWHMARGDETRAEAAYRNATQLDPSFAPAAERLSAMLLDRRVRQTRVLVRRAEEDLSAGRYSQALDAYTQALAQSPTEELTSELRGKLAYAYSRLAFDYYDHCYYEGALGELERAKQINPNVAEIYYVMGRIYHDERNPELARSNYEQALSLDPTHMKARTQLLVLQEQASKGLALTSVIGESSP